MSDKSETPEGSMRQVYIEERGRLRAQLARLAEVVEMLEKEIATVRQTLNEVLARLQEGPPE